MRTEKTYLVRRGGEQKSGPVQSPGQGSASGGSGHSPLGLRVEQEWPCTTRCKAKRCANQPRGFTWRLRLTRKRARREARRGGTRRAQINARGEGRRNRGERQAKNKIRVSAVPKQRGKLAIVAVESKRTHMAPRSGTAWVFASTVGGPFAESKRR